MTSPDERLRALVQTRQFLQALCYGPLTSKVPEEVRREAERLLRHYPLGGVLHLATLALPGWFAWPDGHKRSWSTGKLGEP